MFNTGGGYCCVARRLLLLLLPVAHAPLALLAGCSSPDNGPPIETAGTTERTSRLLDRLAQPGYQPENHVRPFEFALEQGGKRLVPRGRTVSLARKPFDLRITFFNNHGLLLNFSFSPKLFDMARGGGSLADPFQAGTGMAEHPRNPDKAVVVTEINAHHYLFYEPSSRQHRCDRVSRVPGDYLCRRRVARLFIRATKRTVPLAQLSKKAVYMVIYQTAGWQAGSPELRRLALKLSFDR